ncbi:hypothetical protein [Duganella rhizosphaerae]|uniref:hypothetical protein n=1 Tax=Duganella rhizosphaerae TaxID=2885763 RepID=UPI00403F0C1D
MINLKNMPIAGQASKLRVAGSIPAGQARLFLKSQTYDHSGFKKRRYAIYLLAPALHEYPFDGSSGDFYFASKKYTYDNLY